MQTGHKKKALEATIAVLFGFGAAQIIRLTGNLILTRILMPELFGIIGIARLFVLMICLFADIGTWPATIRSERSNDPVFLNTVWTVSLIRGGLISIICLVIAYPVSSFYNEPVLFPVIIFLGLLNIPGSCESTSLILLHKHLQQKTLAAIEIFTQIFSLLITIFCAYFFRNIWALLLGELAGTMMRTVWSHLLNREMPNKIGIERKALKEILVFGKWILISTAIMALSTQVDRMILGKIFTMSWLGVYGIALALAEVPRQIIAQISDKVLYPFLSQYSGQSRENLRKMIQKPRGRLLPVLAVLLAVFACFSDIAIRILYDNRYSEAAWILPILVLGMWPMILVESIDSTLLSVGKPKYFAISNAAKLGFLLIAVPSGYFLGGTLGAVIAIAMHDIPPFFVFGAGLKKEGLSLLKQEFFASILLLFVIGLILCIRILSGMGLPGETEFLMANRL